LCVGKKNLLRLGRLVPIDQRFRRGEIILRSSGNTVARDKIDTLRARYRPQLAAYRKVIGEMTDPPPTRRTGSGAGDVFMVSITFSSMRLILA